MSGGHTPAGSDADLRAAHVQAEIDARRAAGERLLHQAKAMMATNPRDTVRRRAERRARESLLPLASALNWAEGTDEEQAAHQDLDDAGTWVRETFGCHLTQRGTEYFETCPVSLGHRRVGMSVGGRARKICSLCGEDLSECEHMRGTAYFVPGGPNDLGWCRVCLAKDGCEHPPDTTYRVSVVSIVTEMELEEVSLVARPAQPDARFIEVPIDHGRLGQALGEEWSPGVPVSCGRCLRPCKGLSTFDAVHG